MESRLAALGIPCLCQGFSLFGPGRKALRHVHDAMHFSTQPSSRQTGTVGFETSRGTLKFPTRFCLREMYRFMLSNAMHLSIFMHTNLFIMFFPLKVQFSLE